MRSGRARAAVGRAALGVAFAPAIWLASTIDPGAELPHAIGAPRRMFASSVGRISYYEDDGAAGVPVVLLHGVGPAGCAYEVRALFDSLRAERRVVAADLPGYGFSERRSEAISRDEYAIFVRELVSEIARRHGAAVDVVAVGTTGELSARAVVEPASGCSRPWVRSLAIVGPTAPSARAGAFAGAIDRGRRVLGAALGSPILGALLHRALTTGPALRLQVGRCSRACVDDRLVAYARASARQPRARVAPLAAALGGLADRFVVSDVYEHVAVPVCFLHGGELPAPLEALVARRERFDRARIPGATDLPHLERPFETTEALRTFWRSLAPRPALRLIRGARAGAEPTRRAHRGQLAVVKGGGQRS